MFFIDLRHVICCTLTCDFAVIVIPICFVYVSIVIICHAYIVGFAISLKKVVFAVSVDISRRVCAYGELCVYRIN